MNDQHKYRGQTNAVDPQYYGGLSPLKADACDTPTNSRIRDGVTYLEQQMSELHGLLASLESRLDTVTTPVQPQPALVGVGKDSNGPASHLFDRLQGLSYTVNEAHARLRSLMARIEV